LWRMNNLQPNSWKEKLSMFLKLVFEKALNDSGSIVYCARIGRSAEETFPTFQKLLIDVWQTFEKDISMIWMEMNEAQALEFGEPEFFQVQKKFMQRNLFTYNFLLSYKNEAIT
jgi:hypothetical protein